MTIAGIAAGLRQRLRVAFVMSLEFVFASHEPIIISQLVQRIPLFGFTAGDRSRHVLVPKLDD